LLGRLDRLLDVVETLSRSGLVGLIDRSKALLNGLQPAALRAEKLNPRRLQRIVVSGRRERGRGIADQTVQFRQEIRESHETLRRHGEHRKGNYSNA
jgi:hypothetical protein